MPIIDNVTLERTRFGYQWTGSDGGIEVGFAGKPRSHARSSPWPLGPVGSRVVAARQVHSASVKRVPPVTSLLPADALTTAEPGITLAVVTADCVPLLACDGSRAVAVHAGWRGIAASIVPRALDYLSRRRPWHLWLGPRIGACCYEVGHEVARQVADVSCGEAIVKTGKARPHLDLEAAVLAQARLQVDDRVTVVDQCTRCSPEALWSYRRDGPRVGRNLAAISVSAGAGDFQGRALSVPARADESGRGRPASTD